jgi:hypothetical protein
MVMGGRWFRVGLVAALLGVAAPAAAADLVFVYRNKHVDSLKSYNRTPYYKMLAECAGGYGSLVARYDAAGDSGRAAAAKAQGVAFANKATARLSADRGIGERDALELIRADVEAGRAAGEGLFREPANRHLSHEQVLDLFCSQVQDAHDSAARFARR